MNLTVVQSIALVIAAVACCIDVRHHRIPNWITFGAAATAFMYHIAQSGSHGLTNSLGGWLVGVAMFILPFTLGGLGAGDVKLVAALGAWLGLNDALWLGLYVGACGGVIALAVAVSRGYLGRALMNIRLLLGHWRVAGLHALPELTIHSAGAPKLAYGVSILAGTVVTVWLR